MKICEEMVKLREGLDKRNIAWVDKSDLTMYRTHFTYKNHFYSAIFGYGSYGGIDPIDSQLNGDKLELMIDDNYPQGWLTAEDVLNIIDKA